jgi:glucuronate isomerase
MTPFMTEDFLLDTEFARRLYHDYAKDQPIFDYHCHLPPQQVAENYRFKNLYDIWLKGDHYKWRAMRTNGVAERLCTGDATDREKFDAWAATVRTPSATRYTTGPILSCVARLVLPVSCFLRPRG